MLSLAQVEAATSPHEAEIDFRTPCQVRALNLDHGSRISSHFNELFNPQR
jgi:hypothetical protein